MTFFDMEEHHQHDVSNVLAELKETFTSTLAGAFSVVNHRFFIFSRCGCATVIDGVVEICMMGIAPYEHAYLYSKISASASV